jgi:hypothetical protein
MVDQLGLGSGLGGIERPVFSIRVEDYDLPEPSGNQGDSDKAIYGSRFYKF